MKAVFLILPVALCTCSAHVRENPRKEPQLASLVLTGTPCEDGLVIRTFPEDAGSKVRVPASWVLFTPEHSGSATGTVQSGIETLIICRKKLPVPREMPVA